MVMIYLSDAVKLLPDFRDSQLTRCAAFFAERSSFEDACRKRQQEHKERQESVYDYDY